MRHCATFILHSAGAVEPTHGIQGGKFPIGGDTRSEELEFAVGHLLGSLPLTKRGLRVDHLQLGRLVTDQVVHQFLVDNSDLGSPWTSFVAKSRPSKIGILGSYFFSRPLTGLLPERTKETCKPTFRRKR